MTVEQLLFDIYFIIMLLIKGLGFTDGPIYKIGILAATGMVCLKVLVGRYNAVQKAALILLAILGTVDWYVSRDLGVPICLALVLAMKGVDKRHAFKVGAVVWGGVFIIQVVTQLMGLRARDFVIHPKFGIGYCIRWALGYSHPNVLQIAYTALLFYLFYALNPRDNKSIVGDRRRIVALAMSFVGNLYIALYSLSYTGIMMYLIFLIVLVYSEWNRHHLRKRSVVETVLLDAILPLSLLFSIGAPIVYANWQFEILTPTFMSRIGLSSMFLHDYGVTLLGRDFSTLAMWITTDCSYMYLLMHGGLIFFLLFMVGYVGLIHWTLTCEVSWENSVELAMLMSCVIAAISEPFAFNTSYKNATLLLLGAYLYTVSERCGESRGWLPGLAGVGDRRLNVPDLWQMLVDLGRRGSHTLQRHMWMSVVTSTVIVCVTVLVFLMTASWPRQVYARMIAFNAYDGASVGVYTPEEIAALESDPDVWVMSYGGPEDPMVSIDTDGTGLVRLEQIRGIVSIVLWSTVGTLLVLAIVLDIRDRHHDKEQINIAS